MAGRHFVHMEISATDPAQADKFYSEVFGWKIEVDPTFDYHQFADSGVNGGFVKPDGQMYKAGDIVPYLGVDDIDSALKDIESHGGKTLLAKTEIPGVGWFAFFSDPSGNRLGLFQTKMQPAS